MKLLLLPLVPVLVLFACGQEVPPGRSPAERPVVSGLRFAEATRTERPGSRTLLGTVQRPDRITLAARVDGRVGRFSVQEGERVAAGALLLTLEENLSAARLQEAEAGLQQSRSRSAAARARLELAEKTYERYRRLRQGEAVTAQEMDRVSAELAAAREELAAAEAAGRQAAAGRSAARIGAGYTRIVAPYAALVVRKEVREGATVMPGAPLVTLESLAGWQVRAEFPESTLGDLRLGAELPVEIPAAALTLTGTVREIVPAAAVVSRSFPVKLDIPEHAALRSGQFARISLAGASQATVTVPPAAVVTRGQLTGVYVLKEGILHYRQVRTGERRQDAVEILSGLDGGEMIVVAGVERARHGAKVEE